LLPSERRAWPAKSLLEERYARFRMTA
jgi:hypothetical protein